MIATFSQFINEGRDAPLYHGTSAYNAESILETNVLKAQKQMDVQDSHIRRFPVVSLTRDFRFAKQWARNSVISWETVVVFEFDQLKLSHKYAIVPYDYWKDSPPWGMEAPRKESEEYIAGDIKNVRDYIKAVYVYETRAELESDGYQTLGRFPHLINVQNPTGKLKRFK